MPTPESAAFLAKKPTVPPTYEGVDFEDNVAVHNARDAIIREQWVRSMMARLVGEELGKCYQREGVNHLEKCGKLRGMYFSFFSFFPPLLFLLSPLKSLSMVLRNFECYENMHNFPFPAGGSRVEVAIVSSSVIRIRELLVNGFR